VKVIQLGPVPPPHGGVAQHVAALRAGVLAHGNACLVVSITRASDARPPEHGVYRPRNSLHLLRMLRALRGDILHVHVGGNITPRVLGLILVCTLMPGCRTVMTLHSGGYPTTPAGRRGGPLSLRAFIFRRLHGIIGVNAQIVAMFARLGVPEARLHMIPPYLGSPVPRSMSVSAGVESFLRAHEPKFISVGQLEPEYGLELQIEGLKLMQEKYPRAGLLLLGSGSAEAYLRSRAAECLCSHRVLFCGDVSHEEALALMGRCDLMLRTTRYDGDAISIREVLELGLPVVATDNGMRPTGVELMHAANAEGLRAAVHRALARGRLQPAERSESRANLNAHLDLYRSLVPES